MSKHSQGYKGIDVGKPGSAVGSVRRQGADVGPCLHESAGAHAHPGEIKKATKSDDFIAFVPHTRVELVIFCVRGRCPGPLDECGICGVGLADNRANAAGDFCLEIECKSTNIF